MLIKLVEGTKIARDLDLGEGRGLADVKEKSRSSVTCKDIVFVLFPILARVIQVWAGIPGMVRTLADAGGLGDGDKVQAFNDEFGGTLWNHGDVEGSVGHAEFTDRSAGEKGIEERIWRKERATDGEADEGRHAGESGGEFVGVPGVVVAANVVAVSPSRWGRIGPIVGPDEIKSPGEKVRTCYQRINNSRTGLKSGQRLSGKKWRPDSSSCLVGCGHRTWEKR
jgi:hypothetical protein